MVYPGQEPVGRHELAAILRARITSGQLKPGDRLPSESTLAQTYDVSGVTARAAVKQLRDEGLAEVVRGVGVIVRRRVAEPELVLVDAVDQVSAQIPSPADRKRYGVPEGVPLLVVVHPDGLMDLYPADRYRIAYRRD
ncbi:winged helix-turn-helix domain-containing protein [Micromonospora sp. NPDC048999]|uniref:winged helix-turn-helix domain-containing protein n=1 Tax=Micromonospora sp. NPDC048999 TaxID=3155391 RepID=UPI003402D7C2